MLVPNKINVSLPDEIYKILVDYYNTAYDLDFLTISESVQRNAVRSDHRIVVRPQSIKLDVLELGLKYLDRRIRLDI